MTSHFLHLLEELHRKSLRMASLVEDIVDEASSAALQCDEERAQRAIERDHEVDNLEVAIEAETVRMMARYQPLGEDLRLLFTILKVNNDLERIADCAVNVAERAKHLHPAALSLMQVPTEQMCVLVRRMLRTAVQAYSLRDGELGRKLVSDDEDVDAIYAQIIQSVAAHASQEPGLLEGCLDLLSIAKNLERIGDHATNIAEDVVFLNTGEIVRHRARKA
ncbi:MAG: phosphate signaling complex protein PhoU [Phycisphaerae bacterium]